MNCIHQLKSATRIPIDSTIFGLNSINEIEQSENVQLSLHRCIKCGSQMMIAKPNKEKEIYLV